MTQTLQQKAKAILSGYAPDRSVINSTKHWLESVNSKLTAALQASDHIHAGYLVNTNTWELLSGLWHVNSLPVPVSTLMFKLTPQLKKRPEGFEKVFINLCSGNTLERAEAFHKISEWATTELNQLL